MKYLHVMTMDSPLYNNMIVEMINNEFGFNANDHEFVFTNDNSYNISKRYPNTRCRIDYLDKKLRNIRNDSTKFDFILMHNLNLTKQQFLFLNKKLANQMIWCVWGSDLYNRKKKIPPEFNFYRKLRRLIGNISFDLIQKPKIKMFNSINIGFTYDEIEVRRLYGDNIRVVNAQYGLGYDFQMVKEVIRNSHIRKVEDPIKIMIGHSAYPFLNHIKIMNELERFKNENIIITIPMNYGDKSYAEKITYHAEKLFKGKLQLVTEFMDPKAYLGYLSTIDIAIFDFKHQAALGNIYLLLYMGKKLFLNSQGIVYQGLSKEGIKVFEVESLEEINYNELSCINFDISRGVEFGKSMIDPDIIADKWRSLFTRLQSTR